ncbi:MAG: hypothetical protein GWN58_21585 [Anaerolineae bacterium]|nr:hypothetical protein [Anaerolineae bacterium]
MLAKVEEMIFLARQMPGLEIQLISGESEGALRRSLLKFTGGLTGTTIRW